MDEGVYWEAVQCLIGRGHLSNYWATDKKRAKGEDEELGHRSLLESSSHCGS